MTDLSPLTALLGGVLTLFAPCSVMLLPTFLAYALSSRSAVLARTLVFWAGLLTTLVPLGVLAGEAGLWLKRLGPAFTVGAAVAIGVLGLLQIFAVDLVGALRSETGRIRPLLGGDRRGRGPLAKGGPFKVGPVAGIRGVVGSDEPARGATFLSVYLLGMVHGFAGVGCAGPILGAVLLTAGLGGSMVEGAVAMAMYATGMAVPLAVLALAWERLRLAERPWLRPRPLRLLGRWTTWTNVVSGSLFVLLSAWLTFFGLSNSLGALVGVQRLAEWEQAIMSALAGFPGWILLLAAILLAAALWLFRASTRPTPAARTEDTCIRDHQ